MPASAYAPESHRALSEAAVRAASACSPKARAALEGPAGGVFAEASVAEDRMDLRRILEWHFYDRTRTLSHPLAFRHASLHPRYSALAREGSLESLGRLSHYLQDVSNPAHVVPLFHPRWLMFKDELDSFPLGELRLPSCRELSARRRAARARGGEFLEALLDLAAEDARRPLSDPSADPYPAPWTCHWRPRGSGWGEYGVAFGRESFSCGGKDYRVSRADMEGFAARRHAQALLDTAAALIEAFEE